MCYYINYTYHSMGLFITAATLTTMIIQGAKLPKLIIIQGTTIILDKDQ